MQIQKRTDEVIRDTLRVIRTQVAGMLRYRWLAMIIVWVICIAGWTSVYLMQDNYAANARVFVDTENAIDDILGGIAAPSDLLSDVNIVVREIMSRPNLAEVARNTDLALRAETPSQFEDLLTTLQSKISVVGNREGVFSISFVDHDRETAISVVDTLLTAFVEGSLGADRTDSVQAQEFLRGQIEEYEARLTEAEDNLATFKRNNVHLMSGQQGDYFSRMQAAESRLEETEQSLAIAVQRRDELQRQLEGEEPVFGIMSNNSGSTESVSSNPKIRSLELQLAELRLQYTDKHPRIGQILDNIELLKQQEERERQLRADAVARNPLQQNPLEQNPVYQNMRIQLTNVEVEIASLQAERSQQRQEVNRLRQRVDTIPQVEAELNRLNRDYDVVKAQHQQLLRQLETANIGEDVSQSIDEVQFRIIDPPYSDLQPVGPFRGVLLTLILIFAIGLAGALTFLLNQLNPTFIGNRSVTEVLGIPVLASVSLVQTKDELRKERNRMLAFKSLGLGILASYVLALALAEPGSLFLRNLLQSVV